MRRLAISVWLLICLSTSLGAQVITGRVIGIVRDASGGVLPGATARLSSPALIGGTANQETNEKGQYRFLELPPGAYRLEIELPGFDTYVEEGLRVEVGGTVERVVTLTIAGLSETVVVSGESPIVDARATGVSTNYGVDVLESTPVQRASVFDMVKAAPGMAATLPSTSTALGVTAFGSGHNENLYLFDGTNITSVWNGRAGPLPDTDVVQEVEILSTGVSAEYGNHQGAVINIVTKQGSNDFRFDASYYFQTQGLTSQPVTLGCDCPDGESGFTRDRYDDFTAHVGGAILKDRLWFFGGYQYQRDYDGLPGSDPQFPRKVKADRLFWKITWQATENLRVMHSFHEDFYGLGGRPSASRPFEATTARSGERPAVTFARVTQVLSPSTLWEAGVSGYFDDDRFVPNSGSYTLSPRFDVATGLASGGAPWFLNGHTGQTSVRAKLSHYASDFLESDHDFRFGVQYQRGEINGMGGYPGGASYLDYGGEPYFAYLREPYNYGGSSRGVGAFAEDVVTIGDRASLSLGLRYDHSRAISPDVPVLDVDGTKTGQTISGLGTLYTWNVLSPRVGFNLKLTHDGRTVLRGSYGRFHQGVLASETNAVHPGITDIVEAFYDPVTGGFTDIASITDPTANVRIDPDTRAPYTDQYSIGLDRQLAPNLALGISYVHKEGRRYIGWEDRGGIYGVETAALPDGRNIEVFPLLNDPSERLFVLGNPAGYYLRYDGLLLTVEKRFNGRWQIGASYGLSKVIGLQASSDSGTTGGQNSSTMGFVPFGRDPNDLINRDGTLPNDRTHMLRFQGTFQLPGSIVVGANFQQLSGKPYNAVARVRLPQGSRTVAIEPNGTRRLEAQTLLDFRISKVFRFGNTGRIELLADIFNLFNDAAAERFFTTNFFSPNFERPNQWALPRRAMIGVKVAF